MSGSREHGTNARYLMDECRCGECRRAHRQVNYDNRQRARAKLAAGMSSAPHGFANTYSYHGCKCDLCVTAARLRWARYRL